MDLERINALEKSLKEYPVFNEKMQESNFSGKDVKAFKKYYNAMHLELIEYVKHKKDKKLSDKVKELKLADELFKSTNKWIALLSITIVFSSILLINMYYTEVSNWMMITATVIVVSLIFFFMRKVQSQPKTLIPALNDNGLLCKKIVPLIKKEEDKALTE